jgi:hypothetical protein
MSFSRPYRYFAPLAVLLLLSPDRGIAETATASAPAAASSEDSYRRGFSDGYRARDARLENRGYSARNRQWRDQRFRPPYSQRRYAYSPYWWRRSPHADARPYRNRYGSWRSHREGYGYRGSRESWVYPTPLVDRWYGQRGWVSETPSAR